MAIHNKWNEGLTGAVASAIEHLSDMAELPMESEQLLLTKDSEVISEWARKLTWLKGSKDSKSLLKAGKGVFRVILSYLQSCYEDQKAYTLGSAESNHVKAIMALVGEAAKKLDKLTALFHKQRSHSATRSVEYRKLQQFYQSRIAHQIDEKVLEKRLSGLFDQEQLRGEPGQQKQLSIPLGERIYVDLDALKKDFEYELFFIRKINGTHFFHPRLLRNLKLICDFSERGEGADPLEEIDLWHDLYYQKTAVAIVDGLGPQVDQFYRRALRSKESELVLKLSNALMALMLCRCPENYVKEKPHKSYKAYFLDFLHFLANILSSHDYHKLVTYPPREAHGWRQSLLDLTHSLCGALYLHVRRFQGFSRELHHLLHEGRQLLSPEHHQAALASGEIWSMLACDYVALTRLMRRHSGGSMAKILMVLDQRRPGAFEPLSQENLPNVLYHIAVADHWVSSLHLPSPTYQEYIHKAVLQNEFRGFLRGYARRSSPRKHLLINLQNRTSWREHQRCATLEGLLAHKDFKSCLALSTLARDTEFNDQRPPYENNNHAGQFIDNFIGQLEDQHSGYYFMAAHRAEIAYEFAPAAMAAIHRLFFSGRNTIPREGRLDFIQIFNAFLIVKLIDLNRPDSFSLTCKDGVDDGACYNVLIYALLKMVQGCPINEADREQMELMLYAPAILVRERVVLAEKFNRMISALRVIEWRYREMGPDQFSLAMQEAFGPLFKGLILSGKVQRG